MRTRPLFLLASTLTLFVAVAGGGVASARTAIAPGQHFVGLINKHTTNVVILMACPTPDPSGTGHPLGGQTIAVHPPSTTATTTGDTGTRGRSITASFVLPVPTTSASAGLSFTQYGSQTLPTSLVLPCSGSGSVVFTPEPTSKTAHSISVAVTFGNITLDQPPSGS